MKLTIIVKFALDEVDKIRGRVRSVVFEQLQHDIALRRGQADDRQVICGCLGLPPLLLVGPADLVLTGPIELILRFDAKRLCGNGALRHGDRYALWERGWG